MKRTIIALAAMAALGTAWTATAASAATTSTVKPAEMTCKELLGTDMEYVPQIVYWLDGFDAHGRAIVEATEDWYAVPVTSIVEDCKKAPEKKAMDVVRKHSDERHRK